MGHADGVFLLDGLVLRRSFAVTLLEGSLIARRLDHGSRTHHVALLLHPFGIERSTTRAMRRAIEIRRGLVSTMIVFANAAGALFAHPGFIKCDAVPKD